MESDGLLDGLVCSQPSTCECTWWGRGMVLTVLGLLLVLTSWASMERRSCVDDGKETPESGTVGAVME